MQEKVVLTEKDVLIYLSKSNSGVTSHPTCEYGCKTTICK